MPKIIAISDTHLQHDFKVPDGDILIHAGDATFIGDMDEIVRFNRWFSELPHKYKVFVPGNHDKMFESNEGFARSLIDNDVHVLINESIVIEGIKIYGSPWTPQFYDWAFMYRRGAPAKACWDLIPEDTDILVTHGPPHGILDETHYISYVGENPHVGCEELFKAVKRIKPRIHIFGHIHHAIGKHVQEWEDSILNPPETTEFHNVAICNEKYKPKNKAHVIRIRDDYKPKRY